jgi:hypothetical protein
MTRALRGIVAVLIVTLLGGAALLLGRGVIVPSLVPSAPPACTATSAVKVGTITVPPGPIAGFCQDRLINAAHIINAARALGIGQHTQAIGVMTAIGESGLVNLDHGDAAGADSRGLFQQRANGAWGSLTDRMTPYTAAYDFFAALVAIPSWQTLSPTQAAHAVQANADPTYYAQYWDEAVTIVSALNRKQ